MLRHIPRITWLLGTLLLTPLTPGGCKKPPTTPAPTTPAPTTSAPTNKGAKGTTSTTKEPPASADHAAPWRDDLRLLGQTLAARHKNAFHHLSADQWEKQIAALHAQLPKLDDAQRALALSRLVNSLGDSHTRMQLPPLPRLPLALYFFDDGIYVVAIDEAHAAARSLRVVSLGGQPIATLAERAKPYVPADNTPGLELETPGYLTLVDLLRLVGAQSSVDKTVLVVADKAGKPHGFALKALTDLRAVRWAKPAWSKTPLRQRKPQLAYWNDYLPASQTVYFRYRRCVDAPVFPMKRFAAGMLAFIDQKRPKRVIIDLRGNRGGNSEVLRPLLDGLATRRKARPFALATLIDRGVFSSALLNALELKRRLGATLVGEPTSGKPNHYGEVKTFRLPHSKLLVQYSTKLFQRVEGNPKTLMPDVRVSQRAADLLAGKDPALEAALSVR